MEKSLRLSMTSPGGRGRDFFIDGIPDGIWETFSRRAKEVFPESGETAWSNVLTEVIAAFSEGETQSLILTDIPRDSWVSLTEATKTLQVSIPHTIAILFARAAEGRLHLLKFNHKDESGKEEVPVGHAFLIYNIPDEFWEAWVKNAEVGGWTGEQMLGRIFEETSKGNLRVTKREATPAIHGEGVSKPIDPGVESGNVARASFAKIGSS